VAFAVTIIIGSIYLKSCDHKFLGEAKDIEQQKPADMRKMR
jgi:hypothetical protein